MPMTYLSVMFRAVPRAVFEAIDVRRSGAQTAAAKLLGQKA